VSATGRGSLGVATFEDFIQTDAAINFGNSGGALVSAGGELVGINTAVLAKNLGVEGIGFAIPVNLVRGVMREILEHGRVIRGWIGVEAEDVSAVRGESGAGGGPAAGRSAARDRRPAGGERSGSDGPRRRPDAGLEGRDRRRAAPGAYQGDRRGDRAAASGLIALQFGTRRIRAPSCESFSSIAS
jgi:hypothetical protein